MSVIIYLFGYMSIFVSKVLSARLDVHYLSIMQVIAQGMTMAWLLGGRRDYDRTHVVLAVDLKSKIGPRFIAASGRVPAGHVWSTDMPALSVKVETARRLLAGRTADEGLRSPPRPGHIYVFGIGDSDGVGDMCTVRAEWPVPEIDWSSARMTPL